MRIPTINHSLVAFFRNTSATRQKNAPETVSRPGSLPVDTIHFAGKSKQATLVDTSKSFVRQPEKVTIGSVPLTIPDILAVARQRARVEFTSDDKVLKRIETSYLKMMEDIRKGIPVYGCNTGYGAQASRVLAGGTPEERIRTAQAMSRGLAFTDISTGSPLPPDITRAAMLIRINALMKGLSAVKLTDMDIYRRMLNEGITPLVGQYGSLGASGDLAQNSRLLSAARHLPGVKVWNRQGETKDAKEALGQAGIQALELDPKAGLGLINGDNFSTAMATMLAVDTLNAMLLCFATSAMIMEALQGTNRSFHPLLSKIRPHPGQEEAASLMRYLLDGSKLAHQEMQGHQKRDAGSNVQDGYVLRCFAQYLAPSVEKLKPIFKTIAINANAVSDNPLWVPPEHATEGEKPWQWVSGGNFLAENMVDAMDQLRTIMTLMTLANDRLLARLVNPHSNNGLSPNVSDPAAITAGAFKGVQIQQGMLGVYSTLLSDPVSTRFGVHEEGNQDVTSHAMTSGLLGLENLRVLRYSLTQNLLAAAQAIDLRGGPDKLSPRTRPLYDFVRQQTGKVTEERPLGPDIEKLYAAICNDAIMEPLRSGVFKDYQGPAQPTSPEGDNRQQLNRHSFPVHTSKL